MDDDVERGTDPERLRRIAMDLEDGLRALYKELRYTGCLEAKDSIQQAADKTLAAARALAPEAPPRRPFDAPRALRELYAAG